MIARRCALERLWVAIVAVIALRRGVGEARAERNGHEEFPNSNFTSLREYCPFGVSDGSGDISIRHGALRMEGRGQHRVLWYRFDYDESIEARVDGAAVQYRDMAIVHTLPTVWFVDPFEKKRLVVNGRAAAEGSSPQLFMFESSVLTEVDLESIEALSEPVQHVLAGRVRLPDWSNSESASRTVVEVGVKVHARYPVVERLARDVRASAFPLSWLLSDTSRVRFDPFTVVVRLPAGQCRRLVPRLERALETQLPAGASRHETVVRWVSFAALGAAVLSLAS